MFYKQIKVGQVKSYLLSEDQSTVELKVFIEPTYANLVRKHTRFWNASGISIDANLSGVKVRSESLASIVAGGIAFATPENRKDSPATDPSLPFRLYEDFDAAAAGIRIKVKLSDFEGLQAGRTPVMYKGIQVGNLKALKVDPDLTAATAELTLDPLAEDYLVDGTQFWVVKPSISLAGITGLEALVKGNYIAIRPGDKGAAPQREFVARPKAPPLDLRSPGLHLVLFTENLGSLEVGSPILYKQVKVGSVQSYQFSKTRKQLVIGVHIEKEYEGLVNASSRFWNASGVTLTGGLTGGIQVKSESLQSLMAGGIAFETPEAKAPLQSVSLGSACSPATTRPTRKAPWSPSRSTAPTVCAPALLCGSRGWMSARSRTLISPMTCSPWCSPRELPKCRSVLPGSAVNSGWSSRSWV